MKIHEYQAKQLMEARGMAVPAGRPAATVAEAVAAVRPLIEASGNPVVVVKSQIHAGGRGKGRFVEHPDVSGVSVITVGIDGGIDAAEAEVGELAGRMLGSTLVTAQTGPEGKQVNRLYVEQGIDIDREMYLSVLLDRAVGRNVVMASTEGGTEIEKVAAETPEMILRAEVDPAFGLLGFQARRLAYDLGLEGDAASNGIRFMELLSATATELDTDLIEINPLVATPAGEVVALDGKMSFEANALYRHPEIREMRDLSEENPAEVEASEHGLSFIKLNGTIGCMVNGAGLAMATMDIIEHVGGEPANFLDVGGAAKKEQVVAALTIMARDPDVKGIFINIFGGIIHCDVIATGVVEAAREVGLAVPLVVRLEGTNVDLGRQIFDESGLDVASAADMRAAAEKILELAR